MKTKRFFAGMLIAGMIAVCYPMTAAAETVSVPAVTQKDADFDLDKWIEFAAPYYRIDPAFEMIPSPLTEEDIIEDVRWCFFTGNYGLNFVYASKEDAMKAVELFDLKEICNRYPELMGFYSNSNYRCDVVQNSEGQWVMTLVVPDPSLTPEKLFKQQREALDAALALRDKLHTRKIKAGMSQKQIVQVYYSELSKLRVRPSSEGPDAKNRQVYMQYDSAYATLVNRKADCVGRAAAFALLMNIEGIPTQGISGRLNSVKSGHVLNMVIADGNEYVCDWGNKIPLQTVEKFSKRFIYDEKTLRAARAALEPEPITE